MGEYLGVTTYHPCGHQAGGYGFKAPFACPVCAQEKAAEKQNTLHAAMKAKQLYDMSGGFSPSPSQQWFYANTTYGSPGTAGIGGAGGAGGAVAITLPPKPTIMEWLDEQINSVRRLAFAA